MKKMQKYIIQIVLLLLLPFMAMAQKHTEFVGLSLSQSPEELTEKLVEKGLQRDYSNSFSGRIAGLNVWLSIAANKDTIGCSHMVLTTRTQQGISPPVRMIRAGSGRSGA